MILMASAREEQPVSNGGAPCLLIWPYAVGDMLQASFIIVNQDIQHLYGSTLKCQHHHCDELATPTKAVFVLELRRRLPTVMRISQCYCCRVPREVRSEFSIQN